MTGLGFLGTGTESRASAVNADGTVVVGYSATLLSGVYEAFRWVEGSGMVGLGVLAGATNSVANGVSADGSVVVGSSNFQSVGNLAFRWVDGDPAGMVSITDLLEDAGVDTTGWKLESAVGVSADGGTIVGNGASPNSYQEAWIARFGPAPGLITPDEAVNSLLTLGQVPNVASSLVYNFLDTTSEYARQHTAAASTPDIQPLGYGEDGVSAISAAPTRPLRVFGYGLGGAAFDEDGWSGAALIGASVAVTDHLVLGGSIGYGAVNSDMGMGGEATIRGPAGTVFIASTPETGFQFLAAGTIAGLDAEIHRGYMNGSGQASSYGETDGTGYGGLVRAGYAFALDDRNRLEPFASYQAVHADLGAYTETGGPFPSEISEMSQTDQVGRLGAELRHRYQADAWVWGSAAWAHRLDDSGIDLAVQLIDLFGVSGTAPIGASDWMEVTAGVSLPVGMTTRLTGSVTAGVFGEGADTLLGRVGVSMAF